MWVHKKSCTRNTYPAQLQSHRFENMFTGGDAVPQRVSEGDTTLRVKARICFEHPSHGTREWANSPKSAVRRWPDQAGLLFSFLTP
jgi:hypothetical protein